MVWSPKYTPSICVAIVQLPGQVRLFVTAWTAARQASLSCTISRSLLKLMTTELMMPSNHLILCRLLLLPSIFPSIRVFSNGLALRIKRPGSFSFSNHPPHCCVLEAHILPGSMASQLRGICLCESYLESHSYLISMVFR